MFRAGLAATRRAPRACGAIGFFRDDQEIDPEALRALRRRVRLVARGREFTIDRPTSARDDRPGRPALGVLVDHEALTIPAEALIAGRTETLTLGVLGQLEATANWHRIMPECVDDPPSTPLGDEGVLPRSRRGRLDRGRSARGSEALEHLRAPTT